MSIESFHEGRVVLHKGDCLDSLRALPSNSVDSVVTDPPYALVSIARRYGKDGAAPAKVGATGAYARASAGFMGKSWDTGERAFAVEFWAEVFRVLKPGGHVLAFSATRTVHRLTCAIEDAGFEIRDMLCWMYGQGFPKSHNVARAIDLHLGVERRVVGTETLTNDIRGGALLDVAHGGERPPLVREVKVATSPEAIAWDGWGSALKPALEPITLARKPLAGTIAENVLAHGTGALNIDACRVEMSDDDRAAIDAMGGFGKAGWEGAERVALRQSLADKVEDGKAHDLGRWPANVIHDGLAITGDAGRYFYTAKADADDRIGSKHPTVKPVNLIQYLARMVTPPGGVILDPFAGTGTLGEAALKEGFRAILCERETEYQADIARRMSIALSGPSARRVKIAKTKHGAVAAGPLFDEAQNEGAP